MTRFLMTRRLVNPKEAKALAQIAQRAQCSFARRSRRFHVVKGWFEGPSLHYAAEEERERLVKLAIEAAGISYPVDP